MSEQDKRIWHRHKKYGNPHVQKSPEGTPLAASNEPLEHCHEGGDRCHGHRIRLVPCEGDYKAVLDETPYFFPEAGGSSENG